jgi:hypothetical protein
MKTKKKGVFKISDKYFIDWNDLHGKELTIIVCGRLVLGIEPISKNTYVLHEIEENE